MDAGTPPTDHGELPPKPQPKWSAPRRWFAAALLTAVTGALLLVVRNQLPSPLSGTDTVRIGYAVEPPYAFVGPAGEVSGEAPEIARVIAARLGIKRIEWRQMGFSELVDQLEAGYIDVIAAGMFITQERARRMLFSLPTLRVQPGMLVRAGNPKRIKSLARAVTRPELRLAVLAGSHEMLTVERLGLDPARQVVVPDAQTGFRAVKTGLADALVLSAPSVLWMARKDRTLAAVLVPASAGSDDGQPAFAFRSDNRRLHEAWNEQLQSYLGSDEHRQLLDRLGLAELAPVAAEAPRVPVK